jgi:hypothetical protein
LTAFVKVLPANSGVADDLSGWDAGAVIGKALLKGEEMTTGPFPSTGAGEVGAGLVDVALASGGVVKASALEVGGVILSALEPGRVGVAVAAGSSTGAQIGAGPDIGVTGVMMVELIFEGVSARRAGGVCAAGRADL